MEIIRNMVKHILNGTTQLIKTRLLPDKHVHIQINNDLYEYLAVFCMAIGMSKSLSEVLARTIVYVLMVPRG